MSPLLTCETILVPEDQARRVREWLAKPECDVFLKLVEGKAVQLQVEALRQAAETDDSPAKIEVSDSNLRKAHKYTATARVIREMKHETKEFKYVNIKVGTQPVKTE